MPLIPTPVSIYNHLLVSQESCKPGRSIIGIILVIEMRWGDDTQTKTYAISWMTDGMHFGRWDITNGITVVRVSKDEH